jgi:hypothetical protein
VPRRAKDERRPQLKRKSPSLQNDFRPACDSLCRKNSPTFEFLAWKIIIRPASRVAEFELLYGGCTLTHNFFVRVRLSETLVLTRNLKSPAKFNEKSFGGRLK